MPISTTGQGRFTGLLGYNRQYEYLGESNLPYRVVEKYSYTVHDMVPSNRADLPAFFKAQFSSLLGVFAGNINITSLDFPSSKEHLESQVIFQKHNISFEVRSSGNFASPSTGGYQNDRNLGLSGIVAHSSYIKDLKDSFSFSNSQGGAKSYNHDLSFSLITGENYNTFPLLKNLASSIAHGIFDNEPDILSRVSFNSYGDFNDSDSKQYFSETFDALNYSFSFSKKRNIETFVSGGYTHSLSHSISFDDKGKFDISEKLKVVGNANYSQALNGFNNLVGGSQVRCENALSGYTALATNLNSNLTSFSSGLFRVNTSETRNIPAITVEGNVSYTNDPSRKSGLSKMESLDISRAPNGVLSITHGYNYTLNAFLVNNTEDLAVSGAYSILGIINQDRNSSPSVVRGVYYTLSNLTGLSTGLSRIKTSVSAPQRGKTYSASFEYSNDPSFDTSSLINPFTSQAITGFNKLSVDFQNTEVRDFISEFKVINRPSQDSVLHYGYQQEPATFSVSFNGKTPRRGNSLVTSTRYVPTSEASELLDYAKKLFLDEALTNSDIYNYSLNELKYGCDSDNSFDMSVQFVYTKKRRGNIS